MNAFIPFLTWGFFPFFICSNSVIAFPVVNVFPLPENAYPNSRKPSIPSLNPKPTFDNPTAATPHPISVSGQVAAPPNTRPPPFMTL